MSTFYSIRTQTASAIFSVLILLSISISASSQDTSPNPSSCTIFNQSCADFGATTIDFNSGPENFTGGGDFTYSSTNGNFEGTIAAGATDDYVIISRLFAIQNNILAVGFNTTGSTATLTSYTIETVRNADNAILATCNAPSPTAGPICFSISDLDQVAGTEVFFRITVNATNASGSTQTILFDDFTYNSSQVAVLPVSLTSFTAKRSDNTVQLSWTTASESNNSGFEIQKRNRGSFETVAFVNTKAVNGNSSTPLQYVFSDNNASGDVSFYRIKMLDIDGKHKFSDIRSVNGLKNKAGILVYPNPAKKETVNVVFNSTEEKDVQLTDLNGRLIRNWKSYRSVDLKLENLLPGVYMLRVSNLVTNDKEIQKIIITN